MSEQVVYRIRDWALRYEVNAKGGEARDGDTLKLRPLDFVRWQVRGRDLGIGLRRVNKIAGDEFAPAVFGVFAKMVEIAAQENREHRGYVLTSDRAPMTIEDLAEATGWSEVVIGKALTVLTCDRVQWIEVVNFPEFPESPEFRAPYITEPNRTEPNRTKRNRTEPRARETSVSVSADSSSISEDSGESLWPDGEQTAEQATEQTAEKSPELPLPPTNDTQAIPRHGSDAKTAYNATSSEIEKQPGADSPTQAPTTAASTTPGHQGHDGPKRYDGAGSGTGAPANGFGNIYAPQLPPADDPQPHDADGDPRRNALNTMFKRLKRTTRDSREWLEWWKATLPLIIDHERLWGQLTELLDYVEKCDGSRPDVGQLRRPGSYVTPRILKAVRAAKIAGIPATPGTRRKQEAVNT